VTTKTTINYGKCTLLASFEMPCPLCKKLVPANTRHECSSGGETPKPKRRLKR
jgi:hypothetical protein